MPEMDLGRLHELDLTVHTLPGGRIATPAGFRVYAYAHWPHLESRRREFLASVEADVVGDLERKKPEDYGFCLLPGVDWEAWRKQAVDLESQELKSLGGYYTLAHGPSLGDLTEESGKMGRSVVTAAQIIFLLRQMDTFHADAPGGASLNKAMWMLERGAKGGYASYPDIRKAWIRFGRVAHLCIAILIARIEADQAPPGERLDRYARAFFQELPTTLAIARDFESWFVSYRERHPSIGLDNLFTVPRALNLREVSVPPRPLSAGMLALLNEYKVGAK